MVRGAVSGAAVATSSAIGVVARTLEWTRPKVCGGRLLECPLVIAEEVFISVKAAGIALMARERLMVNKPSSNDLAKLGIITSEHDKRMPSFVNLPAHPVCGAFVHCAQSEEAAQFEYVPLGILIRQIIIASVARDYVLEWKIHCTMD